MALSRDAIVFIHGLDGREPGVARDRLISGLVETTQSAQVVSLDGNRWITGYQGRAVQVDTADGRRKIVEVYEAYWGDLIPATREETPLKKLLGGTGLLLFWLGGLVRSISPGNGFYFSLSMFIGVLLLTLWYVGVVALAMNSLGADLNGLPFQPPGWILGLIVVVASFLPLEKLVNMARFTRLYLKNVVLPDHDIGLQDRIRFRAQECLRTICTANDQPFDRIIVVGHSIGAVVGIDLFSGLAIAGGQQVHLVTLGSPSRLFAHRSPLLQERLAACLEQGSYTTWVDFNSRDDWFNSAIPDFPRLSSHLSIAVRWKSASWWDRLNGETHLRYPATCPVAELLVDHPGKHLPQPWKQEVIA